MSRMLEALLRLERKSESLNFADEVRRVLQEPDQAAQSTQPAAKVESFDAMRWQAEPIPNLSRETTNVLVARAFDAAMVLIGFGIFLGPWVLVRGTLTLGSQNAPILGVVVALLVFFLLVRMGSGRSRHTRYMLCQTGGRGLGGARAARGTELPPSAERAGG